METATTNEVCPLATSQSRKRDSIVLSEDDEEKEKVAAAAKPSDNPSPSASPAKRPRLDPEVEAEAKDGKAQVAIDEPHETPAEPAVNAIHAL